LNYKNVYKKLIEKAKSENRIKSKLVYFERHHIIPDFMFKHRKRKGPKGHLPGDPNDPNNIVLLTPREHFLSHIFLFKSLRGQRYEYPAGAALQFFFSKVIGCHTRSSNFNAANSRKYETYRLQGLDSISKCRSGKIPAVHLVTREKVGSVSILHPKVLSGEWVHHSKGRKMSEEEKNNRPSQIGGRNTNYKQLTNAIKDKIFSCIVEVKDTRNIVSLRMFLDKYNLNASCKRDTISRIFICHKFGSFSKLIELYNLETKSNLITQTSQNRFSKYAI
jgi:hypothetical protein